MTKPRSTRPADTRARAARVAAVAKRIEKGTPVNHACALESVSRAAFYEWIAEDAELATVIAKAKAVAGEREREKLEHLITKDKRAANVQLHYLQTRFPDEYPIAKQRVEATGKDDGPVRHAVALTIEQALAGARDGAIPGENE